MSTDDSPSSIQEASTAATGPPPPAPTPAGPTEGTSINGREVTLVWHPLLGVRQHRVQIAADADFDDVRFETTTASENAVRVRWPVLPEAGDRFWRVQGFRHGAWGPYSRPAAFHLTGKEEAAASPEPSEVASQNVPHMIGVTSGRQAVVAILVLLVAVAFMIELAVLAPVGSLVELETADGEAGGGGGGAPPAFEATPASLERMAGQASAAQAGEQIFSTYCASCHGQEGGGGIGPNLADRYWIHGGTNMDIYQVLVEGVSSQGMPSWEGTLSDREMAQLVSFIRSLEGTEPPGAIEPQGELVEETAASSP